MRVPSLTNCPICQLDNKICQCFSRENCQINVNEHSQGNQRNECVYFASNEIFSATDATSQRERTRAAGERLLSLFEDHRARSPYHGNSLHGPDLIDSQVHNQAGFNANFKVEDFGPSYSLEDVPLSRPTSFQSGYQGGEISACDEYARRNEVQRRLEFSQEPQFESAAPSLHRKMNFEQNPAPSFLPIQKSSRQCFSSNQAQQTAMLHRNSSSVGTTSATSFTEENVSYGRPYEPQIHLAPPSQAAGFVAQNNPSERMSFPPPMAKYLEMYQPKAHVGTQTSPWRQLNPALTRSPYTADVYSNHPAPEFSQEGQRRPANFPDRSPADALSYAFPTDKAAGVTFSKDVERSLKTSIQSCASSQPSLMFGSYFECYDATCSKSFESRTSRADHTKSFHPGGIECRMCPGWRRVLSADVEEHIQKAHESFFAW